MQKGNSIEQVLALLVGIAKDDEVVDDGLFLFVDGKGCLKLSLIFDVAIEDLPPRPLTATLETNIDPPHAGLNC